MSDRIAILQPAMPLSAVERGATVVVRRINGGRQLRHRLYDLGLVQGAHVRVLKNDLPCPMIVAVRENSRVALGRGMTLHILVSPLDCSANGGEPA